MTKISFSGRVVVERRVKPRLEVRQQPKPAIRGTLSLWSAK